MPTLRCYRSLAVLLSTLLYAGVTPSLVHSATCQPGEIDALIDETGNYLRTFSQKRRPLLHEKFQQLGKLKDWPPQDAIDEGYKFTHNSAITKLDNRARKLLIELDQIGARSGDPAICKNLDRLKAVTLELRTVTEAKFNQIMARVNTALQAAEPKAVAKPSPKPSTLPTKPRPKPPRQGQPSPKPPPPAKVPPWQTTTETAPPPVVISALPPREPMPAETTFSASEIRDAGRGFFGNISAGLASVIQFTFKNYGKPNGYILGTEGGGAFLAGISFGKGRLHTKQEAARKVFWQGPTVGYDLGVQTSRVMILVYNLRQADRIFRRYGGIGGSAYVVGGVGLTFHKRGRVVLAPIRTGLGLRLGANIGYLKFTPKLSINPF